jgi:hypothetical protein
MEGAGIGLDRADSRALVLVGLALGIHHGGSILVPFVAILLECPCFRQ